MTPPLKSSKKEVRPVLNETFPLDSNETLSRRASNQQQVKDVTNYETFTRDGNQEGCPTPARRNSIASNHDNVSAGRSRSCEDTLKHYDGQVNLMDCRPTKKRNNDDDEVFGNESTRQNGDKGLPPMAPRRYKRQPTIENPVCFQEVSEKFYFPSLAVHCARFN